MSPLISFKEGEKGKAKSEILFWINCHFISKWPLCANLLLQILLLRSFSRLRPLQCITTRYLILLALSSCICVGLLILDVLAPCRVIFSLGTRLLSSETGSYCGCCINYYKGQSNCVCVCVRESYALHFSVSLLKQITLPKLKTGNKCSAVLHSHWENIEEY